MQGMFALLASRLRRAQIQCRPPNASIGSSSPGRHSPRWRLPQNEKKHARILIARTTVCTGNKSVNSKIIRTEGRKGKSIWCLCQTLISKRRIHDRFGQCKSSPSHGAWTRAKEPVCIEVQREMIFQFKVVPGTHTAVPLSLFPTTR
jgi:hypothetical protein